MADDRVLVTLRRAGVRFRVHEHARAITAADRVGLPFDLRRAVKTLAFSFAGDKLALVALRGSDRLDYRRFADALGVPRSALKSASVEQVDRRLGAEPGGIAPLSLDDQTEVIFDVRTLSLSGSAYVGSGRSDRTVEADANALAALPRARVAEVAVAEDAPPPARHQPSGSA